METLEEYVNRYFLLQRIELHVKAIKHKLWLLILSLKEPI